MGVGETVGAGRSPTVGGEAGAIQVRGRWVGQIGVGRDWGGCEHSTGM